MFKKLLIIGFLIIIFPFISYGIQLSANDNVTCLINNGKIYCDGALLKEYRDLKTQFKDVRNAQLISVGGTRICYSVDNNIYCYGSNASKIYFQPTSIIEAKGLKQIVSGSSHTCILDSDENNAVKCWGLNNSGQLGNGTTTNSISPVIPNNLYNPKECESVIQISTHSNHTCAIILKNTPCALIPYTYLKCWGSNNYGQLGNGKTINDYSDLNPPSPSNIFERIFRKIFPHKQKPPQENQPVIANNILNLNQVITGLNHTCYRYCILEYCYVKCFGLNKNGQLGNGINLLEAQQSKKVPFSVKPVLVQNLETNVSFIASGDNHNCAIVNNGEVKCWGNNNYGQLGDGTRIDSSIPVLVKGIDNAVSLSLGAYHSCALLKTGEIKCWGNNVNGQLLNGNHENQLLPVTINYQNQ